MSVQPCALLIPGDSSGKGRGCLLDTTTGRVFGPVFDDIVEADDFQCWVREGMERDPRRFTPDELEHAVWKFRQSRKVRGEGPAGLGGEAGPAERASGSRVVGPGAEGRG